MNGLQQDSNLSEVIKLHKASFSYKCCYLHPLFITNQFIQTCRFPGQFPYPTHGCSLQWKWLGGGKTGVQFHKQLLFRDASWVFVELHVYCQFWYFLSNHRHLVSNVRDCYRLLISQTLYTVMSTPVSVFCMALCFLGLVSKSWSTCFGQWWKHCRLCKYCCNHSFGPI